jgi:hypothetical protein
MSPGEEAAGGWMPSARRTTGRAFEKARDQALPMADVLSDGIRRQFPKKF